MERRNCCDVILKILEQVPSTETDLITALKWNYEDASFKAPEQTIHWNRTQKTLMEYILNPKEDWEFNVWSIFSTLPVDEIRREVENDKNRGGV